MVVYILIAQVELYIMSGSTHLVVWLEELFVAEAGTLFASKNVYLKTKCRAIERYVDLKNGSRSVPTN